MISPTTALVSGAVAGLVVDISLFPIDTIKTRLQSEAGFYKAGGFRGIYSGLTSVAIGSAPGAALFFLTYEATKYQISQRRWASPAVGHVASSSVAEVMACLIRVPSEVVKQRSQAGGGTSLEVFRQTLQADGARGLYRGFLSTISREIPFSIIQFPIWELLKAKWSNKPGEIEPWKSAVAGAVAGSIAAFCTTPLDVAKTRIMLAQTSNSSTSRPVPSILDVLSKVYTSHGIPGLWAGVAPRVLWIAIGGFIFLGAYDGVKRILTRRQQGGEA